MAFLRRISWKSSKELDLRAPEAGHRPAAGPKYGIKTLYDPVSAVVDLVFVHGLRGDRDRTWTARGAAGPWPGLLLPLKVPDARVLTFGYDSNVVDWRSMVSNNKIGNHAVNLISALATYRGEDGTTDRPIIFVAHSLGGLVCENALVAAHKSPEKHLRRIRELTHGIVFLGTPHSGSGLALSAERLAKSIGLIKQTNSHILEVLRKDSETLAQVQDEFHAMLRLLPQQGHPPIQITCFYEEIPMAVIGEIVPQRSAKLPGYTAIGIRKNHREMARYTNKDEPGFISIAGEIQRWADEIRVSSPDGQDGAWKEETLSEGETQVDVAQLAGTEGDITIHGNVVQSCIVNGNQTVYGGLIFRD